MPPTLPQPPAGAAVRPLAALVVAAALVATGCSAGEDAGPTSTPSPTASSTPSTAVDGLPPRPDFAVQNHAWQLGSLEVVDGSATLTTTLSTRIAVPVDPVGLAPDAGFPVTILLHDRVPACRDLAATDNPLGDRSEWPCSVFEQSHTDALHGLATTIARQGHVVVVPNLNVVWTEAAGQPDAPARAAQVIAATLARLSAGDDVNLDPTLLDLDHVVLAGHGVGGELANALTAGAQGLGTPSPPRGLLLLAPSHGTLPTATALTDEPTVVVVAGCDGTVGVDGGDWLVEANVAQRETPVALITMAGATHLGFVDATMADAGPESETPGPGCTDGQALDPVAQQEALEGLLPDAVDAILGVDRRRLFDQDREGDELGDGLNITHLDPTVFRRVLMPTPDGELPIGVATLRGGSSQPCLPEPAPGAGCDLRGLPGLSVAWPTATLDFDDGGGQVILPIGVRGRDRSIVVRVLVDPRIGNPAEPVTLSVRDAGAGTFVTVLDLEPQPVTLNGDPDDPTAEGMLRWHELRIPLLADLDAVIVEAARPGPGRLLIAAVELVGT